MLAMKGWWRWWVAGVLGAGLVATSPLCSALAFGGDIWVPSGTRQHWPLAMLGHI